MHRSVLARAILFSLFLSMFFSNVNAVPMVLSHQGRLLDAGDAPISGTYTIIYSIHDAPVGGTQLWMEDHVGVVVTDGLFSVELGSTVPLPADIFDGSGGGGGGGGGSLRYLQVQLSGQPPISPRTPLLSVPSAMVSGGVYGETTSGAQRARGIITKKPGGGPTGYMIVLDADDDGDTVPESEISQSVTPTTSNVAIKTKGTGADPNRVVSSQTGTTPFEVSGSMSIDDDGDTVPESEISQLVTPTTSSVAINTKGTGAEKSRVVVQTSLTGLTPGASAVLDTDSDGDGVPEGEISQSVTPTTCGVAIKTKGTGADANKSASLTVTASPGGSVSAVSTVDLDGDNDPESEFSQSVTPTTCGVAIKAKGTGADKDRVIGGTCDDSSAVVYLDLDDDGDGIAEGRGIISVKSATGSGSMSASSRLSCDPNEDGAPDSEISQIVTPTTCGVAIKVKGTGAEKNRTAGSNCDDSLAVHYLDIDDDGDGNSEASAVSAVSSVSGGGGGGAAAASYARWYTDSDDDGAPEGDISQSVTPTVCGVAIKTKGTGADANRTALLSSTTEVGEISTVSSLDEDGDGLSESSISQRIAPTTSSLAIKTKGTSAQRTQTISGDCDDESSVLSLDTDDDGDGTSDAKVVLGSGASLLGGALPGGAVISSRYDSDDDGIAEQGIDQIVTPTTSSVAIKTKGTGADPNRVIGGTDDTTATILMATDSASISMKVRNGGVIKGSIIINNGSALRMVEMGSDGNSYFASGVGVGVDPTHHIDVVGGAYCDGTNWVNASDRNSKENFESVNGEEILEKISELEITKWNYKGDDDAQHIGPTAQDFKKTFGVGADEKSISTIDPSGIALAAIKELYAQLQAKDKEMKELREEMAKLKKEMAKKK